MAETRIQIVDEHDNPIAGATKQEAFAKGLIRQIVRGITEDEQGRLLLHKRAPHKQPNPNLWDWLPSGHVDEGELYDNAIRRESEEELGIPSDHMVFTPLEVYYSSRKTGDFTLNNFGHVYRIGLRSNEHILLDKTESTEFRWFTPQEVAQALQEHPEQFSPGVHLLFPKYYQS